MPQYLAPGVYIEEVQSGPPPIEGVGTSTAGFVGVTRRGPVDGPATLVTCYADFVRAFGGAFDFGDTFTFSQDLPPAIRGFFDNGGQTAFVARVLPDGASLPATATATATLSGGIITRLTADVPAGASSVYLRDLRGITEGTELAFSTMPGAAVKVSAVNPASGQVTLSAALTNTSTLPAASTIVFTTLADDATQVAATGLPNALASPAPATARPESVGLSASSPGSWGSSIQIVTSIESAAQGEVVALVSATQIHLNSAAGFYVGAWVEIDNGSQKKYFQVSAVAGPVLTLDGATLAAADVTPGNGYTVTFASSCEFGLVISYTDPVEMTTVQETYHGLTLADVAGRYYSDQLANSALVTVTTAAAGTPSTNPFLFPCAPDGLTTLSQWQNGSDPLPSDRDVLGYDNGPNNRSGLLSIADVDEVAIMAAPGITSQTVQEALIDQCETLLDRFAVLDPVSNGGDPATLNQIESQRNLYDSEYAALYYPRLVIANPITTASAPTRTIAPSGHVLGVYARVDQTRGVYKAPANELVQGILSLETTVSTGVQDILNPLNINAIRDFTSMQRGLRIYGARCVTSDSSWNYVNVRRLFIFIEESLDIGTQWVVFEPNDEKLWAQVVQSVSLFLTGVWQSGALMGSTPAEAFYVTADRTTMTDDDILNGRFVMEVGIAPVRPAEFVVIRIGQWLGGSSVQQV